MNRFKKFTGIIILLFAFGLSSSSCSSDDVEDSIDCLSDIAYVDINHSVDGKTVTFNVTYSGEHKLDTKIHWDFGDGTTETLTGVTQEHTYNDDGSYQVKANITTRNGDAHCSHEEQEHVKIDE